jgi:PB1 domain
MSKVLKIKHELTGDIRRVSLSSWPDLATLDMTLLKLFGSDLPTPYILRYADEEGDLVSITSTSELREAAASVERTQTPGRAVLSLLLSKPSEGMSSIVMSPAAQQQALEQAQRASGSPSAASSSANYRHNSNSNNSARVLLPTLDSMSLPPLVVQGGRAVTSHWAPLYIDQWAPDSFKSALSKLMQRGYGWEQSRDALIDFGGEFEQALGALQQAAPKSSTPGRAFFLPAFQRSVEQLEAAGFPREVSVGALIRNGGVAQNAVLELAGVFQQELCPKGHLLEVSSYSLGTYKSGWFCDRCRKNDQPGQRWHCRLCSFDVCFGCLPAPQAAAAGKAAAQLTGGAASSTVARAILEPARVAQAAAKPIHDDSMPASLLVPVRQLEAMGFTDRMRNIELLVKNDNNITAVAVQLSEERRAAEQKEEARRRAEEQLRHAEQERKRRAEEAKRRREAEARRREEERLRREQEAKRRQAANAVVKTPEKLGNDIAHLTGMGFDTVLATTSLVNHGGDLDAALEYLLGQKN